jgi:hypothetical protein
MDKCLYRAGTTSSLVLDCEGLLGFAGFCVLDTGDCLGHSMTLGADFAVSPILLMFVTLLYVGK